MCQFFSALYTRDGAVRFCETDAHEDTVARLGWPDDRPLETRGWVRVEALPAGEGWGPVWVDETSAPAWCDEDRAAHEGRILAVAARVRPAREAYEAVRRPAWDAYTAALRPLSGYVPLLEGDGAAC